jgi:hypothetical protein
MAEVLSNYLSNMAAEPFSYDGRDCMAFAVGWFDALTGKDALAIWRGRYRDADGCRAYAEANGGIAAAALAFLAEQHGARAAKPRPGNVVLARFRDSEAIGIRVDEARIALRTERGLVITHRARPVAEWGLS